MKEGGTLLIVLGRDLLSPTASWSSNLPPWVLYSPPSSQFPERKKKPFRDRLPEVAGWVPR